MRKAVKITKWFLSAFPLEHFHFEFFFHMALFPETDTHATLSSSTALHVPVRRMYDGCSREKKIKSTESGKKNFEELQVPATWEFATVIARRIVKRRLIATRQPLVMSSSRKNFNSG